MLVLGGATVDGYIGVVIDRAITDHVAAVMALERSQSNAVASYHGWWRWQYIDRHFLLCGDLLFSDPRYNSSASIADALYVLRRQS